MQEGRWQKTEPGGPESRSGSRMPSVTAATEKYIIDPGISRFTVRAFATGLLSMLGHSPTIAVHSFAGEVQMAQDSLEGAGLHLKVEAASLAIQDAVSENDRREMERQMQDEVLETRRFPQIVYEGTSVSGSGPVQSQQVVRLNGQLKLHGITRNQPVDARVSIIGGVLRASGEISLQQTDYDIKLASAMAGALRIKDELKLSFDIAARKQKQ